ncbi:hypothetical protein E4U12_007486, partial [Claviceps purpurea]
MKAVALKQLLKFASFRKHESPSTRQIARGFGNFELVLCQVPSRLGNFPAAIGNCYKS